MNAQLPAPFGLDRLRCGLLRPTVVALITGVALLLMTPSLFGPFVLDDHIFEVLARADTGVVGLRSRPWDLLTFTTGDVQDNHALIDEGVLLPWWAHEHHLNSLFRPLSVLTHRVDLALWPHSAFAAHLHSLLWFALLLWVLSRLYRALSVEPWVAGLSLLLFAVDDVHGPTVSWIANRNAILAVLFGALGVLFHHRARTILAAVCVALALASAESGIIVYAYLFAYAVTLDRKGLWRGCLSLWPFVPVALVWRAIYTAGGFGTFGSDAYLDPARDPWTFLAALSRNLPALLGSQLGAGLPLADAMFWTPLDQNLPIQALAWLTLLVMGLLVLPTLVSSAHSRFWALAMVLAAVPLSASALGDRLLLPVSVAASALIAMAIAQWVELARVPSVGLHRWIPRLSLVALLSAHMIAAPLLLPMRASVMGLLGATIDRAERVIPETSEIRDRTVVIVNAPLDVMVSYIQLARARLGTLRPRHLVWLATASSPFSIHRSSDRTLRLMKPKGILYTGPERHYRAASLGFAPGDRVKLSELEATIGALTADGRPSVVDFAFNAPLEDGRYLFLEWKGTRLVRWSLPREGESRQFGAEDLFAILARDWL